ncbi:MAG: hypothetical protein OXQ92_11335 [Boseongicola sp.]|nr:hypothetical protein [Boseongicola sp.]
MNIPFILKNHYPGDDWILEGDDDQYDGLIWRTSGTRKPTLTKLQGLWDTTYAGLFDAEAVRQARAVRFAERPLGDQLDAIIKGFDQLRADGVVLPAATIDLVDWSLEIKAELPKPDAVSGA